MVCFPVTIDTGNRRGRFVVHDVVLLRFPERRFPPFAAEWAVGKGTADQWLHRVAPTPAGIDPGWRLFTDDGRWRFDRTVGEWLAVDDVGLTESQPSVDNLRQWLDRATADALELAARLGDASTEASPAVAMRPTLPPNPQMGRNPAAAPAPGDPEIDDWPSWTPYVVGIPLAIFLAFGAYFEEAAAELSEPPQALAWILLIGYLIWVITQIDRRERRERPPRNAQEKTHALVTTPFELSWKTIIAGSIILAICSLLN